MKRYNHIENGFNAMNRSIDNVKTIGTKLNDIQKKLNNIMSMCESMGVPPASLKKIGADLGIQLQQLTVDLNRQISIAIYYKKELLKNKKFLNKEQIKQLTELDDIISNVGKGIGPVIHGMIQQMKMVALSKSSKALLAQLRHFKSGRRTFAIIRKAWRTGASIALKVRR